ncbi:MAG: thioredoxin family protein [Rhodoferax sp.]|nr:thioredoxin family protein [Rhodoferax sp.]
MPNATSSPLPRLLVACLCAQWCGTCRDYRPLFDQLQTEFSEARFVWIDIEDESDLVDPIEVDNFPTLLVVADGQARFFGTLTPHIDTLRRILQTQLSTDRAPSAEPQAQALAQRLLQHLASEAQ